MPSPDPRRTQVLQLPSPFPLDRGGELAKVRVAYRTWGSLNPAADNAVVICHALTGSADADSWWGDLFGPGRALDPDRDFIVCSNVLGSCYGTTGPTEICPDTEQRWGPDFPAITIRDMVRVQAELVQALGIRRIRMVLGGSLGGMQTLEWAALYPDRVGSVVAIATSGRHSAWCIGLSEAQRQAICADPLWKGGRYLADAPPAAGLAAARMVAMCTYRSWGSFQARFGRSSQEDGAFAVESYLNHQGRKLVDRFDANSYVLLTRAMDSHDLGRGRGAYEECLARIQVPALIVSIPSDALYPPSEQEELARGMPNAELARLESSHGHDGFLIEVESLNDQVHRFRNRIEKKTTARPGQEPAQEARS